MNQKRLQSNLIQFLESENYTFIGLRDMLIENNKVYLSVVLKDPDENYTLSIVSAEFKVEIKMVLIDIGTPFL